MEIGHDTSEERQTKLRDIEDEIERIRAKLATMPPKEFEDAITRLDDLESRALQLQKAIKERRRLAA